MIDKITAIEPAKEWWRTEINGVPTEYQMPSILGDIDAPDASFDLIIAFGVLHHIPNVSHVLAELNRVAASGAIFAIREPIYSMGDWRHPRKGLTPNERGLPLPWLYRKIDQMNLRVVHKQLCSFPPSARLAEKFGLKRPYSSKHYVILDAVLSDLFRFNYSYHRPGAWKKFAPTSVSLILEKYPT